MRHNVSTELSREASRSVRYNCQLSIGQEPSITSPRAVTSYSFSSVAFQTFTDYVHAGDPSCVFGDFDMQLKTHFGKAVVSCLLLVLSADAYSFLSCVDYDKTQDICYGELLPSCGQSCTAHGSCKPAPEAICHCVILNGCMHGPHETSVWSKSPDKSDCCRFYERLCKHSTHCKSCLQFPSKCIWLDEQHSACQ